MQLNSTLPFNNILYIGDEPKTCLSIIEKFNNSLLQIEQSYQGWFSNRNINKGKTGHDKLQHHIHYNFEGGVVVVKFREEDELPFVIRKECLEACQNIAAEQLLTFV
jgi:hypothetical protein